MAKFTMKFNDTNDHHEHGWLVFKDGVFVTGFAGSNAAERFIRDAEEEQNVEACISRAEKRRNQAQRDALAFVRRGVNEGRTIAEG